VYLLQSGGELNKMNKYYFDIPAKLTYTVEAETEKKAKEKLINTLNNRVEREGVSIEKKDYENVEMFKAIAY
jgi:hypothetical protein